jgi:histidinol-phosphate aminotransferase
MTSVGELRRRTYQELTRPSYSISRTDMLLLNDNANLFGVNPAVEEVLAKFDFGRLWAYPSESSENLRSALASEFGIAPEEVIVGNGSDEILDITSKSFINPGDLFSSPAPTFSMYKFYATMSLAKVRESVLRPDFSLNAEDLLSSASKLVAICQPNNPTANLFDAGEIRKVLSSNTGVTVLDEAYADFVGTSMLKDVMNSDTGIDIRTFSKGYGIAGLRAGFACSRAEVIDELRRVRTPFGLNSFSEAVAIAALDQKEWVRRTISQMKDERAFLSSRLEGMGFKVYPSCCNFLLCDPPVQGPQLVAALKAKGVAIRDCDSLPLLKNHVRITIAPRPMLESFLERLEPIVAGDAR